jgi:chemotaxis protein CheD
VSQQQRTNPLPEVFPGFENINRYWDRQNLMPAAKILPGQYYVTRHNEIITTVLGSCVSACIRDRILGIGGMNHFMLPISDDGAWIGADDPVSTAMRYGNHAMEMMINDILSHGGCRKNLEIKVFGGAQIMETVIDIGGQNIKFIHQYLKNEGLLLLKEDVGDIYPRKILFFPATGRVRLKKLRYLHNNTIVKREEAYRRDLDGKPIAGDIELF